MSQASDFAVRIAAVMAQVESAAESAPVLTCETCTATVTKEGYASLGFLKLTRKVTPEVLLTQADALALGQWLVATFGEGK